MHERKDSNFEDDVRNLRLDTKKRQFVQRKREFKQKQPNFKPISERFRKEIEWPLRQIPHSRRLLAAAPHLRRDNAINDAYDSRSMLQSIRAQVYPEQLNAIGAFSFMCSLVEGRIYAMYEARRALIQGIQITSESENESRYLFLETGSKEYSPFISLNEAIQMLERYSDIDQALISEIHIYQKIRNPLTHEAFLRREHFTHDILVGLAEFYEVLQKYRASQNSMIKRERVIFSGENANEYAMRHFVPKSEYTRVQIYQRLGGGIKDTFTAPFRNGKPAYVIMPKVERNGLQLKTSYVGCGVIFQERKCFSANIPYFIEGGKSEKHTFKGIREVNIEKTSKDYMCIKATSLE